jgi:hypothetical protein
MLFIIPAANIHYKFYKPKEKDRSPFQARQSFICQSYPVRMPVEQERSLQPDFCNGPMHR